MALGWAVLVILVLSALWACRAVPPLEPGQQRGVGWVWGASKQAQAEPLPPSRRRRDDGGQQPTATTLGHGHSATMLPSSNLTDSLESDLLLGSVPPPAPFTNTSLQQGLAVPNTELPTDLQDETDPPDPGLLLGSVPPPAPFTSTSLQQRLAVPITDLPTDLQDETDPPDPGLLLGSVPPPAPFTNTSLQQGLAVPTITDLPTDLQDETDPPDPGLLLGSVPPPAPSTQTAPQKSFTTVLRLTLPSKEGTAGSGTDSNSVTSPALSATITGDKVKKSRSPHTPTPAAPWHTKPEGTTEPAFWEPSRVVGKCLLAMLLLALVAATFMVCTGVLGTLLWRRARSARRRLSHTEMICISSLLPDSEVPTNGPRAAPGQRPKLLLNGGSEVDGDNLTLSSFLPEHS
ncbi:P-selectin glycoprotein ligand 1 isoform X2 [Pogoniulus pusillus]